MPQPRKRVELLSIDNQNDFGDENRSSLRVPGAQANAENLAGLIGRLGDRLDDIHETMDTHQKVAIFHPIFWVDSHGNPPGPFTQIPTEDVEKGKWRASYPPYQSKAKGYTAALKANGRYDLTIWPYHVLVGSWGWSLIPVIAEALSVWEDQNFARVDFVMKGHNPYTEHYSAVQADVTDPDIVGDDPSVQLNTGLVQTLERADIILLAGQALSHCVANTVRDIANSFGPESVKKLVLLTDASSPVPGFETLADAFLIEMQGRGMQTCKCKEFSI